MSWRKISMKFPGTCVVCKGRIEANEVGLWAQGLGVKHEGCAKAREPPCAVCGRPAGCAACELRDDCDLERVSGECICRGCSESKDPLSAYRSSVGKRFKALGA